MSLKEINAILGERLSAEDEENVLAEFETLESEVCLLVYSLHISLALQFRGALAFTLLRC